MSLSVGILVTNYKAWPVTEQTVLAALQHGGDAVCRVLIVDDCSDAPETWTGDARVSIHRNAVNLGYVRSVNAGMAMMTEDIIVMLDCDARPLTPFVEIVQAAFAADEKLGAFGFMQTDDSGLFRSSCEVCPFVMEFVIGPAFWSRLPKRFSGMLEPKSSFLCVHSCCFAIRRAAFCDVGGFDESFDFLDADVDFSISLNRKGWKTVVSSSVMCFHPGGGSPQSTTMRVIRLHRNRWKLLSKHGLVSTEPVMKVCLAIRHMVELVILALVVALRGEQSGSLKEKISCRLELLHRVWNGYQ